MAMRPSRRTLQRFGLLTSLYLAQGLPFGFFTQALPVLLRKRGLSLGAIGLSSLLALPWALKFVWAPLVDRFHVPRFGRRRSWIVPMQALSVLTLVITALHEPAGEGGSLGPLLASVFAINLFAATQDIATDGLAVDILPSAERGLANGIQVAGYRAGMIIGGGALLVFFASIGWRRTFLTMALMVTLTTLPIVFSRAELPGRTALPSEGPRRANVQAPPIDVPPSRARFDFFRRSYALPVLTLLVIYKFGDVFAMGMLRPFLADLGLSLADLGWLLGTVGFLAGLLGALTGGALVGPVGRRRALVLFGTLQALTIFGYAFAARGHTARPFLYFLCAAEHFAGGMATAALFTCMMDWTAPETSATDYTIQASAVVIATGAASSLSGFSAQRLGYPTHFLVASVLAIAAPPVVGLLFPRRADVVTEIS